MRPPRHGRSASAPQDPADAAPRSFGPWDWFFAAALVTAVVAVYQPAWRGGFIWDDDAHVTRPDLRSWQGLGRIWFDLEATQQYYPLLHTAFWIEHKLWGDAVLGYHLVNIFLHAAAALLAALILRRLKVPGAYLAAAIFALHPVEVESVAWITEQKNTLSAVFYLAAMLVYLRFDQWRSRRLYVAAIGLFALGLLSKTVTATLPGALLVSFWWQRGRLSWKRDVLPLMPFFVLGPRAGLFTAWVERRLIGAEGAAFDLTLVDRGLIAGRVVWFYLGKLVWPTQFLFIYPRWQIDQAVWWQYAFPLAAMLSLAVLWAARRRWRGPLAGVLFYVGTLFPVLGFCNVYPFLYSYVADHFQYLAGLGIITLAAAGLALLLDRCGLWRRPGGYSACLALLAVLAALTWQQSRMYADIETLYQTTIDRNPNCWMARNNLGTLLLGRGQVEEAEALFHEAMDLKPDDAQAHTNLGLALAKQGRLDDAVAEYRKALELKPNEVTTRNNLGVALRQQGRLDKAVAVYQEALEINPQSAELHDNLGNALSIQGRFDEAAAEFHKALEINPQYADAYGDFGTALCHQGRRPTPSGSTTRHWNSTRTRPKCTTTWPTPGRRWADWTTPWPSTARRWKSSPTTATRSNNLGAVLYEHGRTDEAMAQWDALLRLQPNNAAVLSQIAWALATNPASSVRNGARAVELARARPV